MTVALVLAIVCFAVLVRSIWGFGDGMLALPLLTLVIGMDQAAPLMALLSAVISVQLLHEQPQLVDKLGIARLVLGALFGVPLGLYVLIGLPVVWAHAVLGVLLTAFATWSLARRRSWGVGGGKPSGGGDGNDKPAGLRAWWLDVGFGLLAGASSAAFDIAGPPMLIYAAARGWSADELRVNLQAVFLPLSLLTLGGHAIAGLWTREVVTFAVMALPIVVLGLYFGPRLRARIERAAEWIVYLLILAFGIVELVRAGLGFAA
jgi:uncharacterized membrane protein YfcA